MRKWITLILVLATILLLCSCGGQDTASTETPNTANGVSSYVAESFDEPVVPIETVSIVEEVATPVFSEEDKALAIETFRNYIMETAQSKFAGVYVYTVETDLTDVDFKVMIQNETVVFSLTYTLGIMSSDNLTSSRTTFFYLTGAEDQQDAHYYAYHTNAITLNDVDTGISGAFHINPLTFSTSSMINIVDFKPTENNNGAEMTDEFIISMEDGIHTTLEVFADILSNSGLGLTLADFGFLEYEIDTTRASEIKSGAWAKSPVAPAPVSFEVVSLVNNSAGVPELVLNITNTGMANLSAVDLYIVCYDAYGDLIEGYGRYDAYEGSYQETIAPGDTHTTSEITLYGFDNTKSVKIAVTRYLIEGGEATVIPEDEYIWLG